MRTRVQRTSVCLLWVVAWVAALTAPALAARQTFTLSDAVPDDVFIFTAGLHNPERAFLEEYWGDVWAALHESGIDNDMLELIGSFLDEDQMGEVDRLRALVTEWLGGVDWKRLASGEAAFAERFHAPQATRDKQVLIGPPDIVVLFRSDGAEENYNGLVTILDGAVKEIEKATGKKGYFRVDKTPRKGVPVVRVNLLAKVPNAPALSIGIARHDDVVAIAMGDALLEDVLDLLDGSSTKTALGRSPRFKAAFAQLPPAEDSMVFFDIQALLKTFRGLPELIRLSTDRPHDLYLNARGNAEANAFSGKAMAAYQHGHLQEALKMIRKAHDAAPDDSIVLYNLACFSALSGDKAEALRWLEKAVEAGFFAPDKIASDDDLKDLRDDARFKKAIAEATRRAAQAEAGVKSSDDAAGQKKQWAALATHVLDRLFDAVGVMDYNAEVEFTEGHSVHRHSVAALVPGAEKRPIYAAFLKGKPGVKFDRFLPAETESFSVGCGMDARAVYAFLEDTLRTAGPQGEALLSKWDGMQKAWGVDVRKDVLGWIGDNCVSVTLADGAGWVFLTQVTDEAAARDKIDRAITFLVNGLAEAATKNPMLGMLAIRRAPALDERITGFEQLYVGMSPKPIVWGVADHHLVFASSADAVALCLDTAKGKHPGIRTNPRTMKEAVVPDGPFTSVALTDQRAMGQQIAMGLGMASMVGGMMTMAIPDPTAQKLITKISGMIAKLSPVAAKIDFFKSTAARTTFDGHAWRTKRVTHYASPDERAEKRVAVRNDGGTP